MNNIQKKILVVDDEKKIVEVVKSYLEHSGYEVYEAFTGKEALYVFEKVPLSLIVLDLMLPDLSGEEICKIIRKKSRLKVVLPVEQPTPGTVDMRNILLVRQRSMVWHMFRILLYADRVVTSGSDSRHGQCSV